MTVVGIVRERAGEARVASSPQTVRRIIALGYEVVVEEGAGSASSFPDAEYVAAGARVIPSSAAWSADIVLTVATPELDDLAKLTDEATLIASLQPALRPDLLEAL